jgi:ABC-type sugar transport system ATPase subunit
MNLMEGMLVESGSGGAEGGDGGAPGALWVAFPGASVPLPAALADAVRGAGPDVMLGVRPEALRLDPEGPIPASVLIVEPLGAETHVICHTESDIRIIVRQSGDAPKPRLGEGVRIAIADDPAAYHLFDGVSGARLGEPMERV